MKKLITILALTISIGAHAQTKKAYEPDLSKPITITMTLPAQSVLGYLFTGNSGGPDKLLSSDKLPGNQIQFYLKGYGATLDSTAVSLSRAYEHFYKEGEAKWSADTLRAYNERLKAKKSAQ